jgi:hypothetical protein
MGGSLAVGALLIRFVNSRSGAANIDMGQAVAAAFGFAPKQPGVTVKEFEIAHRNEAALS